MRLARLRAIHLLLAVVALSGVSLIAADRISGPIQNSHRSALNGNVHPLARSEFDRGAVDASMLLERVTLIFSRTDAQQKALDRLLSEQQDPKSTLYHQWLTPEHFGEQFGLSQSDFNKVASWLASRGLKVRPESGRSSITFDGTAAQIDTAFQTSIHQYVVDGKTFYANATAPTLPAALASTVTAIRSLNNFRPRPRTRVIKTAQPRFTSSISGNHFLAPDDFAKIYNLAPLYSSGTDGTGESLAIMGQTNINISDIDTFRSVSGLPKNEPETLLITTKDPGIVSGDIDEASLDLEWSGAVARNATIIYVFSNNGVMDALQYAILNNVAPVISISYGDCETNSSVSESAALSTIAQQANAQGQTIIAASGDSGAADCDFNAKTPVASATHGLVVDMPASVPYVTGVGGTTFNEGTSTTYWNSTNSSTNESVLSYIPEVSWNDTSASIANKGGFAASGGGLSSRFTKPSWQASNGLTDEQRDVPDLAFAASSAHDGYLGCSQGSCVNGYRASDQTLTVFGGTSAGVPTFAGVVALLNQKSGGIQGNVNPRLYALATSTPNVFHDITSGDNKVPCTANTNDCPNGGMIGYNAGPGYDLVTGLGSVDAAALINGWGSSALQSSPDFQIAASSQNLSVARGATGTDSISVAALHGFSGTVTLTCSVASSLPGTACAVSPGSVTSSGGVVLTVTAPTASASLRHSGRPFSPGGWMWSSFGVATALLVISSKRKRVSTCLACVALLACALTFSGCGGGSGNNTTSSTIATTSTTSSTTSTLTGNITVQATSGTLSHSVTISLTVK